MYYIFLQCIPSKFEPLLQHSANRSTQVTTTAWKLTDFQPKKRLHTSTGKNLSKTK